MEETFNQRVEKLIFALQLTKADFARVVAPGGGEKIYRIFRDADYRSGYDTITSILTAYPKVNPDWLLLGQGEMFRTEKELELREPVTDYDRIVRHRIDGIERIEITIKLNP